MSDRNDLATMQAPTEWPLWPVLPVKNREMPDTGGWPKLGIMIDIDHCRFKVFLISADEAFEYESFDDLKDVEVKAYDSLEHVIQAGWVVD